MRRNDPQLQELLRLARSCLKHKRLPREPRPRDFFDRFEAESAYRKAEEHVSVDDESSLALPLLPPSSRLELSPTLEAPGDPPPDVAALRRQIVQIERATAAVRQDLEAASADLSREVLKRCGREKELKTAEAELQRQRRELQLAKQMVRRQTQEMKMLHEDVQAAKAKAAEQVAVRPPSLPAGPRSGRRLGRERPGVRASSQPRTAGDADPGRGSRPTSASARGRDAPNASLRGGPAATGPQLDVEELRNALSPGLPGASDQEAHIWGRPSNDTVSELNQRSAHGGDDAAGAGGGDGGANDAAAVAGGAYGLRPRVSPWEPPKQRTFEAVLAGKPRRPDAWKLYIP